MTTVGVSAGALAGGRDRGLLGSVQRALRVLDGVSHAEEGVTVKAVARRAGLHLSTTYHLLNTLVHEGYLVRLGDKQGFGVGYKIPVLYRQLRRHLDLTPGLAAVVADVHHQSQAAAYYAGFRDSCIVLAHVVDSRAAPASTCSRSGSLSPRTPPPSASSCSPA